MKFTESQFTISYYESQENQIEVIFIDEIKDDVLVASIDTGYCFPTGKLNEYEQNIVEGMFIQSEIMRLEHQIEHLKNVFEEKELTIPILDNYMIDMNTNL